MHRSSFRALHGFDAIKCGRHQLCFHSTSSSAPGISYTELSAGVNPPSSDATPAKPRRRLSALGSTLDDIKIPGNFRATKGPKITPHRAPGKDYSPSIKWMSDDLTGASFAVRAAMRRAKQLASAQQQNEDRKVPTGSATELPSAGQALGDASHVDKFVKESGRGNLWNGGQRKGDHRQQGRGDSQRQQGASRFARLQKGEPTQQSQTSALKPTKSNYSPPIDKAREKIKHMSNPAPLPPQKPIQIDMETTDFAQLFSVTSASPTQSNKALGGVTSSSSRAALRVQLAKERVGGDYSRHLSPELANTTNVQALGPVHHATLLLARRRGTGLRAKHHALEIVQRMAGMTQEISV